MAHALLRMRPQTSQFRRLVSCIILLGKVVILNVVIRLMWFFYSCLVGWSLSKRISKIRRYKGKKLASTRCFSFWSDLLFNDFLNMLWLYRKKSYGTSTCFISSFQVRMVRNMERPCFISSFKVSSTNYLWHRFLDSRHCSLYVTTYQTECMKLNDFPSFNQLNSRIKFQQTISDIIK
jgi:hypothetical protein